MWKNDLTPYHMETNPINSLLYPLNPANISSHSSTVYTNCLSTSPMEHHQQIGGMPLHLPVGGITDQTDENHLQELILEPPDLVGDVFVGHFDRQTANGILVDNAVQDDLQVRSGQLGLFIDNCEIPRMDEVCGVAQESPVDMTGLQNFQYSQTSRHFAFPVENFESNPSTRSDAKNKIQMRWTTELHECFVQAVKDLGGPDRATPKAIVKHMKVNWLKIEHVKSHLQKYRDKCCRLCCDEDTTTRPSRLQGNKRSSAEKGSGTSVKFAQETDMLRLQLELQKGLHEQLLIQRQLQQLQVRSEANSQRLQMLLEEMKRLLASHLISSTSSAMAQPSLEPLPVDNVVSAVDDDDGSTVGSELEFLLLSPKRMRLEAYESENYEVAE